jgi:hypothetical protein
VRPVVIVQPLSGYVNRLQAIVSASLLASDLDADLAVSWQASEVAPVEAESIFNEAFRAAHLASSSDVLERWDLDLSTVPQYLTVDRERARISLAGFDLGEQHFMPQLRQALKGMPDVQQVVIRAGGKFTLEGGAVLTSEEKHAFARRRHAAYQAPSLHPDIEGPAAQAAAAHDPFVGLHLRYSDRSHQAPMRKAIAPAVQELVERTGASSVFVASDVRAERERWLAKARAMGLDPWSMDQGDYPRSDPRSATGALVDWRILTRSVGLVYFAESSFAEEAAVASAGLDVSIGLRASRTQAAWARGTEYANAALTYPRRHGWLGPRG